MENLSEIKKKLLNSDGLKSLRIESTVFQYFKKLQWQTEHSPYFMDLDSKKLRELDIKARRYFVSKNYSSDVGVLVECKSLNNYHIIANNESSVKNDFDFIWMGNYVENEYSKLDELLLKHGFTSEEVAYIKEKLHDYCFPELLFRWVGYKLLPFEIQTFNTYRETNINTTKEVDNSVVWKCVLSLQSAITAHEGLLLANLDYSINDNKHRELSRIKRIDSLIDSFIYRCNHVHFLHPVIVVESKLWEYTEKQTLKELKYFRLNIQRFFQDGFWVDIVNFEHLKEYLDKTKTYVDFHKGMNFKVH